MKLCWVDIRSAGESRLALRTEAIHQRVDAIVAATIADLAVLPPTIGRVLFLADDDVVPDDLRQVEVVIVDPDRHGDPVELSRNHPGPVFGAYLEVLDAATLELACQYARVLPWTVLRFRDPTKIPLEIVLAAAAAAGATGRIVTVAADPDEAAVIFGVLERGSEAVLLAPTGLGQVARFRAAARSPELDLALVDLEITGVTRVGMGERACVDTCTYLRPDEGILVGSHSKGLILCVSETHPLPYMPTRPFRVNAGAIMSYTLSSDERTHYLSELRAGSRVLAVDALGHTRVVTVGRTKIETRPLLSVDAVARNGQTVNLILQDDWHVRVLGPGGAVLNSTELRPGDLVLGYLPTKDRHVGHPIDELCYEQ